MVYWMVRLLIQVLVHKGYLTEQEQRGIFAQAKIRAGKDAQKQAEREAAAMNDLGMNW